VDEHFDAVVIGSGFGGSVAACRLAENGKTVCVLERGKRYAPGYFPRSPRDMQRNFWDPASGRRGLFDVWSFRSMESVVSAGLGGGSLIYANVLIRKDEHWFVKNGTAAEAYEHWPITREVLDPFYACAEKALGAQVFPFDDSPYDRTAKTMAMHDAAVRLGIADHQAPPPSSDQRRWYRPNLAVSFGNSGEPPKPASALREEVRNLHGVDRQTCRLCGECDIGCNFGAKNSLDLTYLSGASAHGACIRHLCEAKVIAPHGDGYRVGYVTRVDDGRPAAAGALTYVTCRQLFLACGTFGTTYLLLNNRANLRALSNRVGMRFSGNGDLLSFVVNATSSDDAGRWKPRAIDCSHGPVITSTFRLPDAFDGARGRGFYLQDAGYPDFLNWLVEAGSVRGNLRRIARFVAGRVADYLFDSPRSRVSGDIAALIGKAGLSADMMPLLAMGRDTPDGILTLRADRDAQTWLELSWNNADSRAYMRRAERFSREIARALGGKYLLDPLTGWLNRLITVHPLGGAPMSRSPVEGVVDEWGEVWGHPNVFVVDGAAMPGPVGPNPSLTIAAFAERCVQHVLQP
jgi:cholesterol oxidase